MRISDWSSDVCSSDLAGLSGFDAVENLIGASRDDILAELARPTPDRLLVAAQALRAGLSVEEIHAVTKYDPWFLERNEAIIEAEQGVCEIGSASCRESVGQRVSNSVVAVSLKKK